MTPPVTDDHRRRAFAAMAVRGLTYEQARQVDTWRRVIDCAAATLRTREWRATHPPSTTLVRRHDPASGRWCTQRVAGPCTTDETLDIGTE